MTDFRKVTDDFSVAPQIELSDLARAKAEGFVLVINNRPDHEAPGQPTSDEMKAAAEAIGLRYAHIPVRGGPTREQADEEHRLLAEAGGPVLAWCRSGTRSITTWAVGEVIAGARPPKDLVDLAADAGYDLSGLLG
ncbi:MAG TPA: TIGR01244 family sulfur transferase [Caulobacteraceae bacterium]|jgi:uncharacterized protein (TIGR01244 family)